MNDGKLFHDGSSLMKSKLKMYSKHTLTFVGECHHIKSWWLICFLAVKKVLAWMNSQNVCKISAEFIQMSFAWKLLNKKVILFLYILIFLWCYALWLTINKCLAYALNAYVDVVHLEQAAVVTLINKSQNDTEKNIHAYKSTSQVVAEHIRTRRNEQAVWLVSRPQTCTHTHLSKKKKKHTKLAQHSCAKW